jgi:hypothetical protein
MEQLHHGCEPLEHILLLFKKQPDRTCYYVSLTPLNFLVYLNQEVLNTKYLST